MHATCAEESREVCTCYSSSEEILFLCWDLASAPLSSNSYSLSCELGTHIPQLQDETDKPFSQEAGKIIISLSGESPKQKHRHTNMLGQKNQTRTGNFVLKTLYPHNIALRCSRSRTLKVGKNLLKACVWSVPPVLRAQTECAVCCIPARSIHSRPQASLAQHNLTEGRRHQSQHGLEIKNSNNSCYLNSEIQQF